MTKITWHEEERPITSLQPFDLNPRMISEREFDRLKSAIKKLGYHHPIAIQPDGTIISGHQRARALQELGHETIRVTVPDRALTEDEFRQMLIQVNVNNGSWDIEMLANDFDMDELIGWGMPEALLTGSTKIPKEKREKSAKEAKTCPNCGELVE